MDAEVLGEELVGDGDRILPEFLSGDGVHLGAGRQGLGDLLGGVARLHHMAGEQSDKGPLVIDDRERAEPEILFLNELEDISDELVGGDLDGILNEALDVVFHTAHLPELILLGHVVVDETKATVERQGDRKTRFRDGIHVGGDNGDVELKSLAQPGIELGLARKDVRI